MKSKQTGLCRSFVVILLSIIQLSAAFPTSNRDSANKNNCYPVLATELDIDITSDPFVKNLDGSKTFQLSSPLWDDKSIKTVEGGQVCEAAESGIWIGTGFRVIIHHEESEHVQQVRWFSFLNRERERER